MSIAAASTIAPAVQAIAKQWSAGHPAVDGKCASVVVNTVSAADVTTQLASGTKDLPDVWIPDSSFWVEQGTDVQKTLSAGKIGLTVDPDIASSPIVIVGNDKAIKAIPQSAGWAALVSGQVPATLADPSSSTEGMLTLLTLNTVSSAGGAAANAAMIGQLVVVSQHVLPDVPTGFTQLSSPSAPVFTASEAAVIQINRSKSKPVAEAVYPSQGTMKLNFPYVLINQPGGDHTKTDVAKQFENQLRTGDAIARFNAAGLRDPASDPVPNVGPAQGLLYSPKVTLMPDPTLQQSQAMARMWAAASSQSRTLAVIDVSGSMNQDAGNGQSRIQVAVKAAEDAIGFFPDQSELGLWVFSTDQTPTSNYAELVPLGDLGDKYGTGTRRQAMAAAAQTIPSRVHGNTALYDTALAAYEDVRSTYYSGKENAVVLLTDGADTSSKITLQQLLSRLKSENDPNNPLPIITIAVGNQADVGALQQISSATGGKTYVVEDPTQIRGVFIDAVIERTCRPNCKN